jgi:hypothetical protein
MSESENKLTRSRKHIRSENKLTRSRKHVRKREQAHKE